VIAAFAFGLLFGWIIVWLWNWLMPVIFGLPTITFWQGVGIIILAKILFGGFSGDHSSKSEKKKHHGDWDWSKEWDSDRLKHKMDRWERWEHYDAWWKAEGKAAFEQYADQADAPVADEAADEDSAAEE